MKNVVIQKTSKGYKIMVDFIQFGPILKDERNAEKVVTDLKAKQCNN